MDVTVGTQLDVKRLVILVFGSQFNSKCHHNTYFMFFKPQKGVWVCVWGGGGKQMITQNNLHEG